MEDGGNARHIRIIDGRFQYGTIAAALTIVLAGVLLFAGGTTLYYLLARAAGSAARPELLLVILPPLLLNDLVIMLLFIVLGILATHRIAGPVYRIEVDIERVLAGEKGVRVRTRKRDAFPDLAERVNELIERIDISRKG
jgi:methyl-accepting chemotaxis protein